MRRIVVIFLLGIIFVLMTNGLTCGFNGKISFNKESLFVSQVEIGGGCGSVVIPGEFTTNGENSWSYRPEFTPYLIWLVKYNPQLKLQSFLTKTTHRPEDIYYSQQGEELTVTDGKLELLQWTAAGKYRLPVERLDYQFFQQQDADYYLTGGLGIYRWLADVQYELSTGGERENAGISRGIDLGINLGSGVEYKIDNRFRLAADGKYHFLYSDNYDTGFFTLMTYLKYQF